MKHGHGDSTERRILGVMLLSDRAFTRVIASIGSDAVFTSERHQVLYDAMTALHDRAVPVDVLTVENALRAGGTLERVGGFGVLDALTRDVPQRVDVAADLDRLPGRRRGDAGAASGES